MSRPNTAAPAIETLDLEEPRPGELLVRIVAAGICRTDLHSHRGYRSPLPIVLGHEGAGIVERTGERVQEFAPGDSVLLSGASCGHCVNCAADLPTYCDTTISLSFDGNRPDGSTALSGLDGERIHSHFFGQSSFATHSVVPVRTAIKIPRDVPVEMAPPLACGVITGAGSVMESMRVGPGSSLAVFGVGGVGLSAVMAARLMDAQHIVAIDTNPGRLALARELGATECLLAGAEGLVERIRATTGRGVGYSLNTANSPDVFSAAVDCLAMNGVAGFVTAPHGDWSPSVAKLLSGGKTLRGILGGGVAPHQFVPRLIDLWQRGRFPFDRLIRTYPFDAIGEAFADMAAGQVIKPVLHMS